MTASIKATIFFEKSLWVALFERTDRDGYAVARHIFGGEPSDPEIYQFIQDHYTELPFGAPQEFQLEIKRMNPKRLQREVRKEMEKVKQTTRPATFAQDYMREELEKTKKVRKERRSTDKEARKEEQFLLKQQKRKEKKRGR